MNRFLPRGEQAGVVLGQFLLLSSSWILDVDSGATISDSVFSRAVRVCLWVQPKKADQSAVVGPGPGCTTTPHPIFTAKVAESPPVSWCISAQIDARTSQIGKQLLAVQPIFRDSDSFNCKRHGRQLAPNWCNFGGGSVWDVVVQPSLAVLRIVVVDVFRGVGLSLSVALRVLLVHPRIYCTVPGGC